MDKLYVGREIDIIVNDTGVEFKGKVVAETERIFIIGFEDGRTMTLDKDDIVYAEPEPVVEPKTLTKEAKKKAKREYKKANDTDVTEPIDGRDVFIITESEG